MGICWQRELIRKNDELKVRSVSISQSSVDFIVKHEDIQDYCTIDKVIGMGSFGTVRRGYLNSDSSVRVAVKTINKTKFFDASELEPFRRELDILMTVDHPNIIKLYRAFEDFKYIHIVTEYCEGGELYERITEKGHYSEEDSCRIMRAVLLAVYNLHSNDICHRDLKPENFMFVSKDANSELKLIDFGLSKRFGNLKVKVMRSIVGTPYFIAPEIIKGRPYDYKCDMWSAGTILYNLICGNIPFPGSNNKSIFQKVKHGRYSLDGSIWTSVSDTAKDLLRKLLQVNPTKRISAKNALNHPWFSQPRSEAQCVVDAKILKDLISYKNQNQFCQEASSILIRYFTYENISELKDTFLSLDKDNNGFLTFDEIEQAISKLGNNEVSSQIKEALEKCSMIERINYSDFLAATLSSKIEITEEMIWNTFKFFDIDKTGYITSENIMKVMKGEGKEVEYDHIKKMIQEVDLDDIDGKISFSEFKRMLTKSN